MADVSVTFNNAPISIKTKRWVRGDPFPVLGHAVGVDTETELITETELTPPLVVLGVYNPADSTCYIIPWTDAQDFMSQLLQHDVTVYLANAGFDYYELESQDLQDAVTRGQVIDLLIRAALHQISTIGFITVHSLKDVCKRYLNYDMDKHEAEGDRSVRVNFRRNKEVTEEQEIYLAIDCVSTYYASEEIGPQATEDTHTRGQIVLYHITKNGLPYDPVVWSYTEHLLQKEMDEKRAELLTYGFPDPYKKNEASPMEALNEMWWEFLQKWLKGRFKESYWLPRSLPGKSVCKRMLLYGTHYMQNGDEKATMARVFVVCLVQDKGSLTKKETLCWKHLTEEWPFLDACDATTKKDVWPTVLITWMQAELEGKDINGCWEAVDDMLLDHQHWFTKEEPLKPQVFIQERLNKLEEEYPGLEFERTPKTGLVKFSKKDSWKLDDSGVKDPFIRSYVDFVHVQKYKTAFCNREFMRPDNRVRGRFGIVESGRTSCSKPNLQQYPSRDKTYPLKNMYKAPEGAIFLSTDFTTAELISLSSSCLAKYGQSVMAKVINSGVCVHRYFAGVMMGLITTDVSFADDPEKAAEMEAFLKAHIDKETRNKAKAVNFGLPGGMKTRRLYQHLRESGVKVTMQEADELRRTWLAAFPEMKLHMDRQPIKKDPYERYAWQPGEGEYDNFDDDPKAEKRKGRDLYFVETITGFRRNRVTYNSCLNTEFQNPVAHLAKESMWNLERAGLGPRLLNMVHDEIDYWLWPHEVKRMVPIIEQLWLEPSQRVFPLVTLKCETTLSLYWDKGGVDFPDVQWDENDCPVLDTPEYVKKAYEYKNSE